MPYWRSGIDPRARFRHWLKFVNTCWNGSCGCSCGSFRRGQVPNPRSGLFATVWAFALLIASAGPAAGQITDNPVFPDVSPLARDGLASVPGLVASQNWPQAISTIQDTLDQHADRVLERPDAPGVFAPVRLHVHSLLLGRGELLDRYRRVQEPFAQSLLEAGRHAEVERSMFMTSAGYEATLRVAEEHLRHARFESARLTLEQLENHPDHAGERAARSAALLGRVFAYLPRAEIRAMAEAWADGAGVPFDREIEWPQAATRRAFDPSSRAADLPYTALTASPLREVSFGDRAVIHPARSAGMDAIPPAWTFPLVVDDIAYHNDGYRVTAYDRYSLRPIWACQLSDMFDVDVRSMRINEPTSLAHAPGLVLTVTGVVGDNGERWGDPRLHAVDTETGRRVWAVRPSQIDDRLRGSIFRGPPVIEGDVAVIIARQADPTLRAVSVFLVGLSLEDGSTRWVRPIASAGSVGFTREIAAGDWPLLHEGVVYFTDRAGAVAAVEAGSGRTRWVRLDTAPPRRSGGRVMTWGVQRPIVEDDSVVVLSSDRRRVLWIDQATGARAGSVGAPVLNDTPQCLVRVDDETLAVISHASIGLIPADPARAEATQPELTGDIDPMGLTGLPIAVEGKLLAPVVDAIAVIDPRQPRAPQRIPLEGAGNVVAMQSQLLVANDRSLRSFLVWDVAEGVLRERIAAEPTSPEPALTLAELAFRSGRHGAIVESLDLALQILKGQPDHPARERAYEVTIAMLEAGGGKWVFDGPATRENPALTFESFELPEALIARLEQLAVTRSQRVGVLMLTGRLAEAREQAARAVKAYQDVLVDDQLADSVWSSRSLTIGAGREATRRLREVVARFGPGAYAEYDARATRELAARRDEPSAVARRYPVARAAARAWLSAAEAAAGSGDGAAELAALEEGARLVMLRSSVGDPIEPAVAGELVGRGVKRLVAAGRLSAARRLIDESGSLQGVTLTDGGAPIAAAAVLDEVGARLGRLGRLPVVGTSLGTEPQVLAGWRLAEPMMGSIEGRSDTVVTMVDDQRLTLGFFEIVAGADATRLERRWERPFDALPFVLHADDERVLVYTESESQRSLESIDAVSGQQIWRIGEINQQLGMPEEVNRRGGGVSTVVDGWRRPDDLVADLDAQTLVLSARNALAMGVSLDDGRVLWKQPLPMDRVLDVSAADGRVVVVGDKLIARRSSESRMLLLDARTGEALHQVGEPARSYRWVKMTDDGLVVAATDSGLLGIRARTGNPAWAVREPTMTDTLGAWVLGDQLLIFHSSGDLLLSDLATGRLSNPLRTRPNRQEIAGVRAWQDDGRIVVGSEEGLRIYSDTGSLLAADGLIGFSRLLTPAAGAGAALLTEQDAIRSAPGSFGYRVRLLDSATGKVLDVKRLDLPEPPVASTLLDGMAIISTPSASVVLRTAD